MQARIDSFINDFYMDMDGRAAAGQFAERYFTHDAVLSHFGDIVRGLDGVEEWYDSIKAGFSSSFHQVKDVQYKQFDDIYAVQADIVWTAAFKNMEGKNRIIYKAVVNMNLIEYNGELRISRYKSAAV